MTEMLAMQICEIVSLQTGLPQEVSFVDASSSIDKKWTTGFVKQPVDSRVWLGETNLAGDGQADTVHHGGPHKAVCAYPATHYSFWREALKLSNFPFGSFGENFTLDGIEETGICIGDIWSLGDMAVQVSQPRQPCWKLARRWGVKDLALRVQETGKTGWYFRVLKQGFVAAGMKLELIERSSPQWTIAEANRIMHHDKHDLPAARELAAVVALSASWKSTLSKRVVQGVEPNTQARLAAEADSE